MLSVKDALDRVAAGVAPLSPEQISLSAALGRVLFEDVAARVTHPPDAVSAMDGYAVQGADVNAAGASLEVIGEAAAGRPFNGSVASGQAVRIFTGGVVPERADTIVIQENAMIDGSMVTVTEAVETGAFVRPRGLDFAAGQVLLKTGQRMTARDVGLLAAMNVNWLRVYRRPRVAIIATGDEVVMPGVPLGPGQIVSSNGVALEAYVRVMGGEPLNLGISPDRPEALTEALKASRSADIVVTTGGASVGDHDLVRQAFGRDGVALDFYKIAMRPGKPLIFGHIGGLPMLGLPGNPVSTGVTALLFLRRAMAVMSGAGADAMETVLLPTASALPGNGEREDYMRSKLIRRPDGSPAAEAFRAQDSAMLATFALSDALIIRPPRAEAVPEGTAVPVLPLGFGAQVF